MAAFIPIAVAAFFAWACTPTHRIGEGSLEAIPGDASQDAIVGNDGQDSHDSKDVYVGDAAGVDLPMDMDAFINGDSFLDTPISQDTPITLDTPVSQDDAPITQDATDAQSIPDSLVTPDTALPSPCALQVSTPASCDITDIAAGGNVTCVIKAGDVYCAGKIDSSKNPLVPLFDHSSFTKITNLQNATQVATGGNHICARLQSGKVNCIGENIWGQLGDGTVEDKNEKQAVEFGLQNVSAITAGYYHTCALHSGNVYCSGLNSQGELGGTLQNFVSLPTEITTIDSITTLTSGGLGNFAIHSSAAAYSWGDNKTAQMSLDGIPSKAVFTPTFVSKSVQDVGLGIDFSCILDLTCQISCGGWNGYGQLGMGSTESKAIPTTTPIKSFANLSDIQAGGHQACAISQTGALSCWGETVADKSIPTPTVVAGLQPIVRVALGDHHTCALDTSCNVYCWGSNSVGQLGIGSIIDSASPVQVNSF